MEESIDLFLVKHGGQLQELYNNINNYILDNQFNMLDRNLRCNRELKLSDFIQRVTEMYLYNLEHYSEENPTIDGAFREVLLQTAQELTDNE